MTVLQPRLLSVALGLVLFLLAALPARAQTDAVLDEIVAVVGDEIVLRSDVDGLVFGLIQQRGMQYSDQLWRDALDQLVDQKVMAIHAQRDTTLIVADDEVEQALNERIQQITRQVGSTAEIERIYGKSLVQIREDIREDFRERLLAERLQGRKLRGIQITPSEVRAWFERIPTDSLPTLPEIVRVAHIVRYPKVSDAAKDEAQEIISAIRDSVVAGQPLEDLARRFSDDPGSASTGGSYEDMRLSDLVPEFGAMASRLPIGELSEPFETDFGYHILRVDARRGESIDFTHVLIAVDDSRNDPTEAIAFLNSVRDSIATGRLSFELAARRHSEEASTAPTGGRVFDPSSGERDLFLEALGPTWQATLDTLEVDELSRPAEVELLDGTRAYHIVRLQRRVPEHRVDLETDYTRIEQLALQEKRQEELSRWLRRLRDDVYLDFRGKAARLDDTSDASVTERRN